MNTQCKDTSPVTDTNKPGCYTCSPGRAGCTAISEYDKLFISKYGTCSGYEKMKQEIAPARLQPHPPPSDHRPSGLNRM